MSPCGRLSPIAGVSNVYEQGLSKEYTFVAWHFRSQKTQISLRILTSDQRLRCL